MNACPSVGRNANLIIIWGVAVKLSKSRVLFSSTKMLFLSLLSVHRHLSMHKMLSLSLSFLSLSLLMAYHSAGAQWQAGGALI